MFLQETRARNSYTAILLMSLPLIFCFRDSTFGFKSRTSLPSLRWPFFSCEFLHPPKFKVLDFTFKFATHFQSTFYEMLVLSLGSLLIHVNVHLPRTICWKVNSPCIKLPFYLCQKSVGHIVSPISGFLVLTHCCTCPMCFCTNILIPDLRRKYSFCH